MKRLTFELGGKSPNVVFADADLDAAVNGAHFALYFNQGQCCCAGSRLFVEDSVHDELIDRLVAKNQDRVLGDPFDPAKPNKVRKSIRRSSTRFCSTLSTAKKTARSASRAAIASAIRATSSSRRCSPA